ncbi:MAG: CapA family protein, partial [Chloroflexota bacterium]|nr:CapA family protein [Chloroflexota bacterium]
GVARVPPGMALVTSPRLPLFGVGPDDPGRLLRGSVADWRALGSPVPLPVEPLALRGEAAGTRPVATYDDYEALVAGLAEHRGGVALVPLDEVDFRVNVLSVGGEDPLREREDGREPTIGIGVFGDVVPGRNVHNRMVEYGDFVRPFRKVAARLAGFDLTFGNLEGNLSDALPSPADPNSVSFVSSPAMTEGFALAGIDAFTLANNHSVYNEEGWGRQGLLDTMQALDAAGLAYFGAGRTLDEARAPWITEVKGTSIALLGIDGVTANFEVGPGRENGVVTADAAASPDGPGTNPFISDQFLADIAEAAGRADVVIPYFHMGVEYVAVPPEWATAAARAAIDAGATLVVTLHPHVIQGMEIYAGKPIVYSPGNFVFDQMFSVEVRSGFILDLTLRGDRVVGLRCHGVEIEDFHQPRPMSAGEQANLMDRFWASTDRLAARGD